MTVTVRVQITSDLWSRSKDSSPPWESDRRPSCFPPAPPAGAPCRGVVHSKEALARLQSSSYWEGDHNLKATDQLSAPPVWWDRTGNWEEISEIKHSRTSCGGGGALTGHPFNASPRASSKVESGNIFVKPLRQLNSSATNMIMDKMWQNFTHYIF